MKKNYFKRIALATLTAGLVFTSCSDNLPDGEGGDKDKTEGEMGYISLALINSSVRGITKAEGATHYGTPDENLVNSAIIVLYEGDASNSQVLEQFILDGGTPASPGGDMHAIKPGVNATTYTTKAQKVTKRDYKLAVFINPPEQLVDATAKNKTINDLETAVDLSGSGYRGVNTLFERSDGSGGHTADNFLMGNFAGLVDVEESDIYDTADEAQDNPVELDVERAVAKITMTVAAGIASTSLEATIGAIKWDVDVVNKKTFWMRKAAPMLDKDDIIAGTTPTGTIDPEVASTDNRIYMYATDPNWDGFSKSRNSSLSAPTGEFTYKSGPLALTYDPTTNTDPVNEDTYAYVTENTMDADEQWEDVTTTVLISAVITPKTTFFEKTLNPGDPYFLYRNMAFTLEDMAQIYAANNDPTIIISNAGTSPGTAWEDLILVSANSGIVALPGILAGMASDFSNYASLLTDSKDVTNSNGATVRFFAENAPNYYYVPIRHFSNTLQSENMAYGRYGVVRNNWYNLSLNSINSYGTAEIPTDRPDPDDKDESWLSIEFTILPWIERGQGIDL